MTFSNHGCNRSYNYGSEYNNLTESTVDLSRNEVPEDHECIAYPYSPVQERHLRQMLSAGDVALRKIMVVEEILVRIILLPLLKGSTHLPCLICLSFEL